MFKVSSKTGISILTALILVGGLSGILGRIVAIALPSIQAHFHANFSQMQWIINANLIVVSVFTLISGSLSDRYGVKRTFNLGILIFSIGCFLSSFSQSIYTLITSQAIIGAGMVLMLPACLAIINMTFLDSEKSKAIGVWVGIGAFFGVLGLLVGGIVIESWGWRIAFSLIAVLGIVTLILSTLYIPNLKGNKDVKIVPINFISFAIGLLGLSYSLIYGAKDGWNDLSILISITAAILGLSVFIFLQVFSKNPLIPSELFKNDKVLWSNIITFMLYFGLNALYVFAIVNFQKLYHFSPTKAGLSLVPPSLLVALFAGPMGKYTDKFGSRNLIFGGSFFTAIGFFLMSLLNENSLYTSGFILPLFLIGIGMVLFVTPLTKGATAVKSIFSGSASSLNNTVARLSGLVAIALLGSIWSSKYESNLEQLLHERDISQNAIEEINSQEASFGIISLSDNIKTETKLDIQSIVHQSLSHGFSIIMLICACFAGIAALLALFFLKN